mmetsp:Transcript_8604/g.23967  ORF Transcript_8604/g.23967 Transcript_8604/m.23967 type:complete len:102 (-) Transcript_8604:265-570(-)
MAKKKNHGSPKGRRTNSIVLQDPMTQRQATHTPDTLKKKTMSSPIYDPLPHCHHEHLCRKHETHPWRMPFSQTFVEEVHPILEHFRALRLQWSMEEPHGSP